MKCSRMYCGHRVRIGAMLVGLSVLSPGSASTFRIAPIRVELAESHGMEALTVRNDGDAPVVVQARVMSWSQEGNSDLFDSTRDVIVTPPVMTIPPEGSQIVRVALRRPADAGSELSYRLFLQEVPQASAHVDGALKVALRLSLPVFVAATATQSGAQVSWTSHWQDDGSLALEASNRGTAHLQVLNLRVEFGRSNAATEVQAARYLLSGTSARWIVKPPEGIDPTAPLSVRGKSDSGEFFAEVIPSAPAY